MDRQEIFGPALKFWRERRRMSQLDLALEANVSQRHLSFLESGRSRPSREMVLQLGEALELPLRERNNLLRAAGFAAFYRQTPLEDARLVAVRQALDRMLVQHMPLPALLFDRYWTILDANKTACALLARAAGRLPQNIFRMFEANPAFIQAIENWPEVAHHMMARLKLELADGHDPALAAMIEDLSSRPAFGRATAHAGQSEEALLLIRMRTAGGTLSLFSTLAQFGTARDITLGDLRVELFFPADDATDQILLDLASSR